MQGDTQTCSRRSVGRNHMARRWRLPWDATSPTEYSMIQSGVDVLKRMSLEILQSSRKRSMIILISSSRWLQPNSPLEHILRCRWISISGLPIKLSIISLHPSKEISTRLTFGAPQLLPVSLCTVPHGRFVSMSESPYCWGPLSKLFTGIPWHTLTWHMNAWMVIVIIYLFYGYKVKYATKSMQSFYLSISISRLGRKNQ